MAFSALLGNVQLSKVAGMERGRRRGGMTNDRDFFFFLVKLKTLIFIFHLDASRFRSLICLLHFKERSEVRG